MSSEDRGHYRAIHSVLLDSPEFLTLSPPAKLVFYTLRFCRENTIACIFVLHSWEDMMRRTGLSLAAITRAQKELEDTHWVAYQYPIVWLRNGLKFSPGVNLDNEKHRLGVLKVLTSLPKLEIVAKFCTYYSLPIPIGYPSNSHPIQGIGNREEGRGIGNRDREPPHNPPVGGLDGFESFWLNYPKKVGKGAARKMWTKLHPSPSLLQDILSALSSQQVWLMREEGKYCPNPTTWLNQSRWEDAPPQPTHLTAQQIWDEAQEDKQHAQ